MYMENDNIFKFGDYEESQQPKEEMASDRQLQALMNMGYKGDVTGSDKRFAFKMVKASDPRTVHIFESAPDLLSYATYVKLSGENWHKETYLSLGGIGGRAVPKALEQFLSDYPNISHIYLHLDNDPPGRNASKNIMEALISNYVVKDCPPPKGKDCNDYLRLLLAPPKPRRGVR